MVKDFSKIVKIISCFTLVALVGCTRTLPPADVEYDHSIAPYHIVGKGESISGIARRYHMDKMELIHLNNLRPPYKIVVGQRLLVRTSATSARTRGGDMFDTPAGDGESMKGDVKVTQLAPLPNMEIHDDEFANQPYSRANQPFGAPEGIDRSNQNYDTEDDHPTSPDDHHPDGEDEPTPSKITKLQEAPNAAMTYLLPVKGQIIRPFKSGKDGHDGINISAPKGTPVLAANSGVVVHAGNQVRGFGNLVLISHKDGKKTVYAHLDEVRVKVNDIVQAGQKIGTVGRTGNVSKPQLHFEIRKGTKPVDPGTYIPLS
jgi:murein DD-endopeptidase MepM/ murein hydrolase activator NlpD